MWQVVWVDLREMVEMVRKEEPAVGLTGSFGGLGCSQHGHNLALGDIMDALFTVLYI